ncbi:DUF1889 family protein, partial [Escherichia sp. TWPC-MK]
MPAVIDKALDFIGAMDVSAPTPSSMNESTAKGIFKYLKELGVPASAADTSMAPMKSRALSITAGIFLS